MSNHKQNAKFTFFYLLSLVALGFMATCTGVIVFQIINKTILDVMEYSGFSSSALRFAISAIIISAPIYYVMMSQINKNLRTGALDKESALRRWLTYLIIFAASGVVMGWLIATVNMFLGGELTVKFILKALTVLIIAGAVFSYYLYDVKREKMGKSIITKIFFFGSIALVLASFITAFCLVDSPQVARDRKADLEVVNDFSMISESINIYYNNQKALPADLNVLTEENGVYLTTKELGHLIDKNAEEKYEYKITGTDSFELCATFKTSNKEAKDDLDYRYYGEYWNHDAGYQCLKKKVNDYSKDGSPIPVPYQ
ncbi:MAG: DUF5671 domain-containing protein [bacterium]